ncbi:hypothetical protein P3T37_001882 [Kitasatospora sp. MAA4]|nr:hypothetical protein [Kitasatospora sp. MAA4]
MDPLVVPAVVAVTGLAARVAAVLCQYLRLRWRVRQEHAHREYVEALARSLPRGSRLVEVHPDGSELRLTIPPLPNRRGGQHR